MKQKAVRAYGISCYLLFLGLFLYFIGFVGDILVPKSIDAPATSLATPAALAVNLLLLGLFAIQHSGMARPTFKRWWTRFVPKAVERSTYVLLASLSLALLMWLWQPLPGPLWDIDVTWLRGLFWVIFGLGWLLVLLSAEMINSDHLFGRQQTRQYARGEKISSPQFQTPGLYRFVRHPLMLGFLIAFWVTPHMTIGHLLFAGVMTVYVRIAIHFEERNLLDYFGARYRAYCQQVPMLIPRPGSALPAQRPLEERG